MKTTAFPPFSSLFHLISYIFPSPLTRPSEEEELPEQLPLALVTAVVVDAAVDGMLIGLSYAAEPSAGWAMAIATCIAAWQSNSWSSK